MKLLCVVILCLAGAALASYDKEDDIQLVIRTLENELERNTRGRCKYPISFFMSIKRALHALSTKLKSSFLCIYLYIWFKQYLLD